MANISNKNEQNVPGAYYVDTQCIACDACVVEAPKFFAMNDKEGRAYVFKQPKTQSEIDECENAMAGCPVEAIGNDGLTNK
jgi:ferredoxin